MVGILRHLSAPRMARYLMRCSGDPHAALDLYHWNVEITGAMWEMFAYLEIALRNTLADRLAIRHVRLSRPGSWLDDPARELDHRARQDIAAARSRVLRKGKTASEGQTISELSFGFWRFLIAKRYTNLWPDLASGFPHAPSRARQTVEDRVDRLHVLRNRLAHHEPVWTRPLRDRYADILDILAYIDPSLSDWVRGRSRIGSLLTGYPDIQWRPESAREGSPAAHS